MRVISAPTWWSFKCKACSAEIEAEPEDVSGRPQIDCDGDCLGYFPCVSCGRCGKEHDVPSSLLTPKIYDLATTNKRKR